MATFDPAEGAVASARASPPPRLSVLVYSLPSPTFRRMLAMVSFY